jgi:isopenicillin N synthase-like dioxygenase
VPGFRKALTAYMLAVAELSQSFTHILAEALGLSPHAFDKYFDKPPLIKMKLAKYPSPHKADAENEKSVQGVGAHKDDSFLTYLLQPTPHTSLLVQNKSGQWICAPPIPRTLVVNIGRILEALTGGVCIATPHQVSLSPSTFISPDTGDHLGDRYSFPVFLGLDMKTLRDDDDLRIPMHIRKLIEGQEERKDEAEKNWQRFFGNNFGEGVFLSRIASHMNVGEAWYPELVEQASQFQKSLKG